MRHIGGLLKILYYLNEFETIFEYMFEYESLAEGVLFEEEQNNVANLVRLPLEAKQCTA
jgi:hypothetical protein